MTEMDVRNMMPGYDYTGAGTGDIPFWNEFATKTGRVVSPPITSDYSSTIFTTFKNGAQNNVRIALSTSNHSLAVQSVTKVDILKMSGRLITKYFYNVMDPAYGALKTISPSLVKNIFIIR